MSFISTVTVADGRSYHVPRGPAPPEGYSLVLGGTQATSDQAAVAGVVLSAQCAETRLVSHGPGFVTLKFYRAINVACDEPVYVAVPDRAGLLSFAYSSW